MSTTHCGTQKDSSADLDANLGRTESEDSIPLFDRVKTLQNLAASICAGLPEGKSELLERFQEELHGLKEAVSNAFNGLTWVISTIHDRRSEWEARTEGLITRTEKQLSKVTATTETATHQILDAVENLTSIQANVIQKTSEIPALCENGSEQASPTALRDAVQQLLAELENAQGSTFQIMDYLQFQDITAQQIEQAYSLLREAEAKLVSVTMALRPVAQAALGIRGIKSTYDANAEYTPSEDKQKQIDALFQK
jgi:chemotaxis regulatin CheY-phosphate phosphatase CheZ